MPNAVPHSTRRRWGLILGAALLALAVLVPASANAAVTKPSSSYYQLGQTSPIYGIKLTGAAYRNKNVFVALRVSYGTLSIPAASTTGLTLSFGYSSFSGQDFSFTGPVANANAALKALQITQPDRPYIPALLSSLDVNITVTATEAKDGLTYYPANQHFYQYVPGKITGTNAFAAAAASTQLGQTGYLASITDSEENSFVAQKIQGDAGQPAKNVWIGASDTGTEGKWVWNGGPDNGVQFWQGCNVAHGGGPFEGRFSAWAPSEPNNYNISECEVENSPTLGEDCAIINKYSPSSTPPDNAFFQGQWNDLPCAYGTGVDGYGNPHIIAGYIIEYGNKAAGGDYSGVDIVTSTLRARPNTDPKVVKPNFFDKVFTLLFKSKKAKLLPKKPKQPATFTFMSKVRVQTAGTYVVTIKRPDGKGTPFQFQPDSSYKISKKVTYKTGVWKMIITTTKDNQVVTVNPVLKTQNWIKPKDTKLFWELKPEPAAINQICWVGWCQSASIPVPKS